MKERKKEGNKNLIEKIFPKKIKIRI